MQVSKSELSGRSLIGLQAGSSSGDAFRAMDPKTGKSMEPDFFSATKEDVEAAVQLAAKSFETYRRTSGKKRAEFLRKIASNIEAISTDVIDRAGQETALPQARLQSETGAHLRTASLVCASRGRRFVGKRPDRSR